MEQTTFVHALHPVSRALHWRRPHEDAALCQARVPAGWHWRTPFAGALYARCPECEQAIWCWLRGAAVVTLASPGAGEGRS